VKIAASEGVARVDFPGLGQWEKSVSDHGMNGQSLASAATMIIDEASGENVLWSTSKTRRVGFRWGGENVGIWGRSCSTFPEDSAWLRRINGGSPESRTNRPADRRRI
jgi:hypothetical protein